MEDWTGGYTADIEYRASYFEEQAPQRLNLAALINGWEPLSLSGPFSYCELGCGQGTTVNLLAATHPKGRFVAVDFNPAHIARARDFAAAAGIVNIEFIERGFTELLEPGAPALGEFDFITLHGVWSWVNDENRRAIVDLIGRSLKPGGLAYVSYNALPGWRDGALVQRALYEIAQLSREPSERQVARGLDVLARLQKAKAATLLKNETLDQVLELQKSGATSYLVHEYLSANWRAFWFSEVLRALAPAKLGYVGTAYLADNFPAGRFTPEQLEILDAIPAVEVRQILGDICDPLEFRRDVFVRGGRRLRRMRQEEMLQETRLALQIPAHGFEYSVRMRQGAAKLNESAYRPIVEALAEGPRSVRELLELPQVRRTSLRPVELVGMLVATRQAQPLLPEGVITTASAAARFNRTIASTVREHDVPLLLGLAMPRTGSAYFLSPAETLAYEMLAGDPAARPHELARAAWPLVKARGDRLRRDGRPIEDDAEAEAFLGERFEKMIRDELPIWRQLGAM
jgi:SAM-dependent methyltransferase